MSTKEQTLDLTTIEVKNLPELAGWKEKMELAVKENPFIEITDNQTYAEAKKNRTALVSARTDVQKQDKLIAKKLKDIRTQASELASELISITEPSEIKQQDEVKKYEDIKEQERLQKIKAEEERIKLIKTTLNGLEVRFLAILRAMTFATIDDSIAEFTDIQVSTEVNFNFEEFTSSYQELILKFSELFESKKVELTENEKVRLENEKLKKQALIAQQKADEERRKLEDQNAKLEAERQEERIAQAKKDLIAKQKNEELQEKLDAIEEEKRIAKEEEDKKLKEEEDKKAAAKKLAEDKARQKRLASDKKLAIEFAKSWRNDSEIAIENKEVQELVIEYQNLFKTLTETFLSKIENL